jgi:hypothetical protein
MIYRIKRLAKVNHDTSDVSTGLQQGVDTVSEVDQGTGSGASWFVGILRAVATGWNGVDMSTLVAAIRDPENFSDPLCFWRVGAHAPPPRVLGQLRQQ